MTAVEDQAQNANPGDASTRCTGLFCYELTDDLRFISHHEELRMLKRTLTRAGWPLRFSQGFNPQPHIVLPLPRRVGAASICEWAAVELDGAPSQQQLLDSLETALPKQCLLRSVAIAPAKTMPHPLRVTYAVQLSQPHAAIARERMTAVLNEQNLIVERSHGPSKVPTAIDIRPYIDTLTLDGSEIVMRLVFRGQRTARPIEILQALDLPAAECEHLVRQVQVEWDIALEAPLNWPPRAERTYVGQDDDNNEEENSCEAQEENRID